MILLACHPLNSSTVHYAHTRTHRHTTHTAPQAPQYRLHGLLPPSLLINTPPFRGPRAERQRLLYSSSSLLTSGSTLSSPSPWRHPHTPGRCSGHVPPHADSSLLGLRTTREGRSMDVGRKVGRAVLPILWTRPLKIQQGKWAFCAYSSQVSLLSTEGKAQDPYIWQPLGHTPPGRSFGTQRPLRGLVGGGDQRRWRWRGGAPKRRDGLSRGWEEGKLMVHMSQQPLRWGTWSSRGRRVRTLAGARACRDRARLRPSRQP